LSAPCPICGSLELVEFADRPAARCGGCSALERHRELVRSQAELLDRGADRLALEIGPLNPRVFGRYLRERDWRYMSVDQSRRGSPVDPRDTSFIDLETDLCDLSTIDEDSVQLVLTQHVIEEIPDYRKALGELSRVLAPAGAALLEIPFDPGRERSERREMDRYGNVWRFGADLPDVVGEHFASVEVIDLQEGAYLGRLLVCRQADR
jgi:SAM-dependent methyltransferase